MGLFSKKITIATHNGKFHADDIFACATLQIVLGGRGTIVRTRDEQVIAAADYVTDVGGIYDAAKKRFDHHMTEGAGQRLNGIPYASFGLVWKEYGTQIAGNAELAERIDQKLVSPIDADDNAYQIIEKKIDVAPYTLQHFLYMYRPTWKESEDNYDSEFLRLVELAKEIILREVKIAQDSESAEAVVQAAYQSAADKRLIVMDMNCPWQELLQTYPEPLIVVTPRRGTPGWGVNVVPKGPNTFENRMLFPEAWAGRRDEDMARVSGVPDAIFCHRARFLAVAKTKEGAIALAQKALTHQP